MLIIAAILTLVLSIAHSYLGEKYIIGDLVKRRDLRPLFGDIHWTHMVIRLGWHVTSIAWLGFALMFAYLGVNPANPARAFLIIASLIFAVSCLISLIWLKGKHRSWIFFMTIAALAGMAAGSY